MLFEKVEYLVSTYKSGVWVENDQKWQNVYIGSLFHLVSTS